MSLKPFKELVKVDVSAHTKKRDGLDYLPWYKAVQLLYDYGAKSVTYTFGVNHDKYPALYDHNGKNPFVHVQLEIDGNSFDFYYPVISGTINIEEPTQMLIHWAQMRALVKAISVFTGLGLNLWEDETLDTEDPMNTSQVESNKEKARVLAHIEKSTTVKMLEMVKEDARRHLLRDKYDKKKVALMNRPTLQPASNGTQ